MTMVQKTGYFDQGLYAMGEIGDYFASRDGAQTTIQIARVGFEGRDLFRGKETSSSLRARKSFEILDMTFAFPSFISNVIGLRDRWRNKDQEGREKLYQSIGETVSDGAESLLCLEAMGVIALKGALGAFQALSWGGLVLAEGIGLLEVLNDKKILVEAQTKEISPEVRDFCISRTRLLYIKVAKEISLIAGVVFSLIALMAPSIACGFLFSPVVALGLMSLFVTTKIWDHFYGRCLELKAETLMKNFPGQMDFLKRLS